MNLYYCLNSRDEGSCFVPMHVYHLSGCNCSVRHMKWAVVDHITYIQEGPGLILECFNYTSSLALE
jgi:hypothetical protein